MSEESFVSFGISTMQHLKGKASFSSVAMETDISSHKAQNSLTPSDYDTMATVITTHIHTYYPLRPKIP
jgi:hypothetical protein